VQSLEIALSRAQQGRMFFLCFANPHVIGWLIARQLIGLGPASPQALSKSPAVCVSAACVSAGRRGFCRSQSVVLG
jgi:hypothetical protein